MSEIPPDLNRAPQLDIQPNHRLGEILVAQGACTSEDVEAALQVQIEDKPDQRIGQILIGQKTLSDNMFWKLLRSSVK